jgi:hypothetical protein
MLLLRSRAGAALAVTACAVAVVVTGADTLTRVPDAIRAGRARDVVGTTIARRLARDASRVALVDIGFLGYASGIEVIDLGGITNTEVSRMRGGHLDKHVSSEWLSARRPDAVLLHSSHEATLDAEGRVRGLDGYPVENRVARMSWLRDEFVVAERIEYAPGYHYVLWLRKRPL